MNYSNLSLIKDLVRFIRPYKKKFFFGSFMRITSDLVWIYPIWAISEIITFATNHQMGDPIGHLWFLMGSILAAALYHFPSQQIAKYHIYQVAEKIGIDARLKTMEHMFKLDSVWHEKENTGNKIRRMHHGGDGLMSILRLYVDLVIESVISLIAITIIFFNLKLELVLILIVFFVSYFLLSLKFTVKASKQSHKANVEWEVLEGASYEAANNIYTIKSLHFADRMMVYLKKSAKKLMSEIKTRIRYFRFRAGFLDTYQEFFRLTILFYTTWQVLQGHFEVGVIALVILYFGKIEESAGELAQVANDWLIAKISVMRMTEILDEIPRIEESGKKVFNKKWKQLHFQKIHFSYGGRKVLKDFSLTINKGENIGIVGLSGEGKSTLFKLLLKHYDHYEGHVRFDKADLKDIKIKNYLQNVAIVPQDTELFNLTLRENIIMTQKTTAKQKTMLDKALKIAHVKDFIHKLPSGVESMIGEKGIKLSGGEKQRVGIARAVYRAPQLLLLDEATSHLDIDSEKKIQDALHQFFQETTAIVIAHRLSTIREMDRIVVIKNGRVEEEGSFKKLMEKKGEFYRLWQRQKF